MRSIKAVLLAVVALTTSGCGTGVFIQKDPMKDALAPIEPGTHTRTDVVALLGEPFVSLPDRGVDVFRRTGELVDVLLPGIPYTTEWTYYTLISYDQAGVLTGIDSGSNVYRSWLKAGHLRFLMGPYGRLLEQEAKPAYTRPATGCALVLLMVGSRWSDALYFKEPIRLNGAVLETSLDYSSYARFESDPGLQDLSVTWGSSRGPWSRERSFECAEGDIWYVTLTDDRDGEPIAVSAEIPAALPGRALVLYPAWTVAPVLPEE